MEQAGEARSGGPPSQIPSAIENLKLALRLCLGHGPLGEQPVTAVTGAIDALAVTVERT